ncbi:MAG: Uma2 family endonuclease [Hyphomicrobium sp.]
MNEHVARRSQRSPTQAAEGLPRWRWTLAEFERFIELGILTEDDRVELIGGELVPMAAKGARHENLKAALTNWAYRRLPSELQLVIELGWRPDRETYCEPDLIFFPAEFRSVTRTPPNEVRLLVEVAESSLKFDTSTKAPLYARLGVKEYWVVNAVTLETRVHRKPSGDAYEMVVTIGQDERLNPRWVPEIALRLRELGLDGE